jgi:hypothetical protein
VGLSEPRHTPAGSAQQESSASSAVVGDPIPVFEYIDLSREIDENKRGLTPNLTTEPGRSVMVKVNLEISATHNKVADLTPKPPASLPRTLPKINLNHGQALWLLSQLGFRGTASESTFREYIKSLRKLGTPFEPRKIGLLRRGHANYHYNQLMELALTLTLRVYHVVPDSLLKQIIRNRSSLNRHYRRAYAQRCTGIGAPLVLEGTGWIPISARGVFLDLQVDFSGGRLVSFGPPRLLTPLEALRVFADRDLATRALLPINLSLIAERVVELSRSVALRHRQTIGGSECFGAEQRQSANQRGPKNSLQPRPLA